MFGLVLAALLGLCVGSFLNVLIVRLPAGESLGGRSRCLHCGHALAGRDLIPLLSFVWLKGRCRFCARPISGRYPAVEFLTALVFVFIFLNYGGVINWQVGWWGIVAAGLIALAGADWRAMILPDSLVFPMIGAALVYAALARPEDFVGLCVTGFFLALGFGILYLVSRGAWLGLGDVKLAFLIGLLLGYPLALVATLAAVWSAALVGLGLIAARRATPKTALPLGAFLAGAAIIVIIFYHDLTPLTAFFP